MPIEFESLRSIPDATEAEISSIHNLLDTQRPAFTADPDYLAAIAFGGTIQSAYVPSEENIIPVVMNPAFDRATELGDRFGIASRQI